MTSKIADMVRLQNIRIATKTGKAISEDDKQWVISKAAEYKQPVSALHMQRAKQAGFNVAGVLVF